MAIELRLTEEASSLSSGDFTNPLCLTFDGSAGGSQEKELYLKNTDLVTVNVEIDSFSGAADPAPYKIYLKTTNEGAVWTEDPITLSSVLPNETQAFLIKVEVDPDTKIQNFSDLKLKVTTS